MWYAIALVRCVSSELLWAVDPTFTGRSSHSSSFDSQNWEEQNRYSLVLLLIHVFFILLPSSDCTVRCVAQKLCMSFWVVNSTCAASAWFEAMLRVITYINAFSSGPESLLKAFWHDVCFTGAFPDCSIMTSSLKNSRVMIGLYSSGCC